MKRKDDFNLTLSYKSPQPGVFLSDISQAQILKVSEAITNLTEQGAEDPVVKVTLALTNSGFVVVQDAIASGEIKEESIAEKLKNFFGGSSAESDTSETPTADPTDTTTSVATTSIPKSGRSQKTIPLELGLSPLSIPPLSYVEKKTSHEKLLAMQRAERSKQQREEARNLLESYVYRLRDLLDGNEEAPFILFSKETEREKLADLLKTTSGWLNANGETADLLDFWSKREALEALERPIQQRHRESETLLPAIADLEQALQAGHMFLESARQNYTIEEAQGTLHKYTVEEIDEVETRLNSTTSWLQEKMVAQRNLKINEDPVILTSEVTSRGKALQSQVMRLLKRKAPKPKATSTDTILSTESTTTSTTANATEGTGSTQGHDEL